MGGAHLYLYGLGRISQHTASGYDTFLGDALGSVRQLVDGSGNVTLTRSYAPYGEPLWNSGSGTSSYGFTGEMQENGLVFLRARYYSSQQGRFISRDTWEGDYYQPASYNKWLYVAGNPMNLVDPSGLCAQDRPDYVECMQIRDDIHSHFNSSGQNVYIDIPDNSCDFALPVPFDRLAPWSAEELRVIREGLFTLEEFWGKNSFPVLFTPITIRRRHPGDAEMMPVDPEHRVTSPVIRLDDNTFQPNLDENNVIGVLWGEMYHLMDYNLSGKLGYGFNNGEWLISKGCLGGSVHSFQFAYAAGWSPFQCVLSITGNLSEMNSPANLVVGNAFDYAARNPKEDFAHTYQVLTQALVGGRNVCTADNAPNGLQECVRSYARSAAVHPHPGF